MGKNIHALENLLLVCGSCHIEIDKNGGATDYTVDELKRWKEKHEARVERLMRINPEATSEIVLYRAQVGDSAPHPTYASAAVALENSGRFPNSSTAVNMQCGLNHLSDRDPEYWTNFEGDLCHKFRGRLEPTILSEVSPHLSIFAIAPQPLLIRLGTLLTDIPDVDVFQLHRDPKGWSWPRKDKSAEFVINRPQDTTKPPVLKIGLTVRVDDTRVNDVLTEEHSIWEVTVAETSRDCIRSKADLQAFAKIAWQVIEEIEQHFSKNLPLKIFPASPVAPMVEFGRLRQNKAHKPWIIFDQNRNRDGFIETLTIE